MATENAIRDNNQVTGLLVTNASATTETLKVYGNASTHGMLVSIAGSETGSTVTVVGNVASGATDSGNPVKVGGVYNSTAPTFTNGQRGDLQLDVKGNTNINAGTLQAGENQTTNRMMVENVNAHTNIVSATTTTVLAGPGFFHGLIINKAVAAGVITMYDSLSGSGTKIGTITMGAALLSDPPLPATYDVTVTTGLTIVTSAAFDITVSARLT